MIAEKTVTALNVGIRLLRTVKSAVCSSDVLDAVANGEKNFIN